VRTVGAVTDTSKSSEKMIRLYAILEFTGVFQLPSAPVLLI
jgi:hypothetical protein